DVGGGGGGRGGGVVGEDEVPVDHVGDQRDLGADHDPPAEVRVAGEGLVRVGEGVGAVGHPVAAPGLGGAQQVTGAAADQRQLGVQGNAGQAVQPAGHLREGGEARAEQCAGVVWIDVGERLKLRYLDAGGYVLRVGQVGHGDGEAGGTAAEEAGVTRYRQGERGVRLPVDR